MNAIYAISFFNKIHLQFNLEDYSILQNQWFNKHTFNRNFNILGVEEIPNFILVLNRQQDYFLEKYIHPGPITNPKFEDRKTITISGCEVILNPAVYEHFRIHQLNDILEELELSMLNNEDFYLIPRKNLLNDYHLPLIYRVKHFLIEGGLKRVDFEKKIQNEFSKNVSLDFINGVLADLDELHIITINHEVIEKAKYFDFFY